MDQQQTKDREVWGVGEFAKYKANLYRGCPHGCLYCYSKANSVKFNTKEPGTWNIMELNEEEFLKPVEPRQDGRTMFPTSHDITPAVVAHCTAYIIKHLEAGNELLVVTKPHFECVDYIVKHVAQVPRAKELLTFRMTIGSADTEVLKFWEPGAPTFTERFTALRCARDAGFQTSVLAEPMLDDDPDEIIRIVRPFVTDSIWLGLMNLAKYRLTMNGAGNDALLRAEHLNLVHSPSWIASLYARYKDDPLIKWKESIKKIVGIARPTERGLDL